MDFREIPLVLVGFGGPKIGPSGAKGPLWPTGRRGGDPDVSMYFSEKPHVFTLIHVRMAETINLRHVKSVTSPPYLAKAP